MFVIIKAEKAKESNFVKVNKLSSHNNKPLAVERLKKLLLEDILERIEEEDIKKLPSIPTDDDSLKDILEIEIDNAISSLNCRYEFSNGEYILLSYNKSKIFSEYVIPSIGKNSAKTISIIAF